MATVTVRAILPASAHVWQSARRLACCHSLDNPMRGGGYHIPILQKRGLRHREAALLPGHHTAVKAREAGLVPRPTWL